MNELPPPPNPDPPAATTTPQARGSVARVVRWWPWLAVAAIAVAGLYAYRELARANEALREQIAQLARESSPALAQARDGARDALRQVDQLKQDIDEIKADRSALDQLVGDVVRQRDDAALIDVERLITLASAELQISGHVPTALAALQGADLRLMQVGRPQQVELRRALGRDMERLRNVPQVDFTGLALKLDQLVQGVDGWPLLADPAARKLAGPIKNDAPPAKDAWMQVRAWIAQEFGDLVRIREVETPDALLLTSSQQQLVRERLKLRLLNARQALLARNDKLFRSDLADAQATINRYFDARAAAPTNALTQLKQIAQTTLTVDVPNLNESLAALRALQGPRATPKR